MRDPSFTLMKNPNHHPPPPRPVLILYAIRIRGGGLSNGQKEAVP